MQIHLNKTLCWLKKYVLFSCHLGWMNRSRFCLPSQKSYRVFPLLGCISKRLWTSQKKYHQSVESEVLAFSTSLSHSQTATGALWVFGCVGNDVSAAAAAAAATIGLRVSIITLIIYSWRRRCDDELLPLSILHSTVLPFIVFPHHILPLLSPSPRHPAFSLSHSKLIFCPSPRLPFSYTYGELTSQNLWSQYVCHFVGITSHNVWSQ